MASFYLNTINLHKNSKYFIEKNQESVCYQNQMMLCLISGLFLASLAFYTLVVPIFFASWHMEDIYREHFIIQAVVMILIVLRYARKKRSMREVTFACILFQLYVVAFVIRVSIVPWKLSQSAIYFAPIVLGFIFAFTYSAAATLSLAVIETAALMVLSYQLKSKEVFYINFFASILLLLLAFYFVYYMTLIRVERQKAYELLEKNSHTDSLTQILNRAAIEEIVIRQMAVDTDGDFALMILDVDEFKKINDTFGHLMGDSVLKQVAGIITEAVGQKNYAGRIGGDEFMLFIEHNSSRQNVMAVAEEIQQKVNRIPMKDNKKISCSIGISMHEAGKEKKYEAMFSEADRALYFVKNQGRNGASFFEKDLEIKK